MLASVKNSMNEKVYARCKYVIQEIIRVNRACDVLLKDDFTTFGQLMYETHDGLSRLYEVSCTELDTLVNIARTDKHVIGARMMGGGFGGCTINLVKKEGTEGFIDLVMKEYKRLTGIETEIYRVAISDGAGHLNH
jgi:galactokinase